MNENLKTQSKVVMTFYNESGDVVKELSKDPANINDISCALNFLKDLCEIRIACVPLG